MPYSKGEVNYEFLLFTDPLKNGILHETRILSHELPSVSVEKEWTLVEIDGLIPIAFKSDEYHHHMINALTDDW